MDNASLNSLQCSFVVTNLGCKWWNNFSFSVSHVLGLMLKTDRIFWHANFYFWNLLFVSGVCCPMCENDTNLLRTVHFQNINKMELNSFCGKHNLSKQKLYQAKHNSPGKPISFCIMIIKEADRYFNWKQQQSIW